MTSPSQTRYAAERPPANEDLQSAGSCTVPGLGLDWRQLDQPFPKLLLQANSLALHSRATHRIAVLVDLDEGILQTNPRRRHGRVSAKFLHGLVQGLLDVLCNFS